MFNWVANVVQWGGYWGVALLMLLENVVPPIPSELIMPMSGFLSARGGMSLWLAVAAGAPSGRSGFRPGWIPTAAGSA